MFAGFLSGVMAMSGSALSAFAIDNNPLATGRELAKKNGCPDSPVTEMVKCLQELPVSVLIQADSGLQVMLNSLSMSKYKFCDGYFLDV